MPNKTPRVAKKRRLNREPVHSQPFPVDTLSQSAYPPATSATSTTDDVSVKLDDLPNEILVKIFKHLPLEDQRKGRRVSRRWRSNLNTPTFFRDVRLCNAAPLGLKAIGRYLKGSVSVETRSLTLSCSRRGATYVLAGTASAKLLSEKCPLLEKVVFVNGKVPVEVLRLLPASVKLISFSHVCVVDHRGKVLALYREKTDVEKPLMGPDTLYNKLTTAGRHSR